MFFLKKKMRRSIKTLQTLRQNGTLAYSQIEYKTYYMPPNQ